MIAQEVLVAREAAKENLFWLETDHVYYSPGFGAATITKNGESHRETGCGDGPIDALYVAIQRAVAKQGVDISGLKLIGWSAEKGRGGSEANAWIEVKLGMGEHVGHARSAHPDTVKVAARAYVKALNQLLCISGLL